MSDYANNLMKAIETGDQEQMNTAWNGGMEAKIGEMLQARKIEIANKIYNGATQKSDSSVDAEDELETEASDGSEEI